MDAASINAAALKSPLTSKRVSCGVAVSPVTPSTVAIASLMASQHGWQQLWIPESFRLFTLPAGTLLSTLASFNFGFRMIFLPFPSR